jgi:tagatose-6-phosphate ketose/aldose isomerase
MFTLDDVLRLPAEVLSQRGLLYTPREIAQQPSTWQRTALQVREQANELRDFFSELLRSPGQSDVLLVGAGSSNYVAEAACGAFRRAWRTRAFAVASTELLTEWDPWFESAKPKLCISFSRSGCSPEGVRVIERALRAAPHMKHLVLTCNADGAMATEFQADARVYRLVLDPAVNDRGLAMTSSFTNMLVAALCTAHLDDESLPRFVDRMTAAGQALLDASDRFASHAISPGSRVAFLGTGPLRGVARECALKLLELSDGHVATLADSFLGVRHGPLAFAHPRTLLVALLSGDARRRSYERDLLDQAQDLGATILTVCPFRGTDLGRKEPGAIAIATAQGLLDDFLGPPWAIAGHLLGLFAAIRCGTMADTPSRNNAISRVVSGVRLYADG